MLLYIRDQGVFGLSQNGRKVKMCYSDKITGKEKPICKPLGTSEDMKEITFEQLIKFSVEM